MIDLIGKRYYYFLISLIVIVPGVIALIVWGLPLAIDFTGGSSLEVKFDAGKAPQPAQVITLYNSMGIEDVAAQTSEGDILIIRSKEIDEATKTKIVNQMGTQFNSTVTILRFDTVGPVIGKEVTNNAAIAVGVAAIAILLYITLAFRGVPHAFRYGTAAIIAMIHDTLVVLGFEALMGHFLGWEADSLFLTALLTVIGFSVHDTIVVFDRIRENSTIYRKLSFERVVNHSIIQTLGRSINTQLTVMVCTASLALFGGITTRQFATVLLVGIFSGTYSSIFNAAPILVVWENREWRNWFGRSAKSNTAEA
ncbi:MAG TPA: protein translocase subunit SecF [Anaerolineaceae bacterium]|nr:protein translocase subunit SecF [Anaerolineaceae bacterium]